MERKDLWCATTVQRRGIIIPKLSRILSLLGLFQETRILIETPQMPVMEQYSSLSKVYGTIAYSHLEVHLRFEFTLPRFPLTNDNTISSPNPPNPQPTVASNGRLEKKRTTKLLIRRKERYKIYVNELATVLK